MSSMLDNHSEKTEDDSANETIISENELTMEETSSTSVLEMTTEDESCFQDINMLLEHGIAAEIIAKFTNAGVNTIKGIQMLMKKNMRDIGLNDQQIEQIQEICVQVTASSPCAFMTAIELSVQRKQIFKLSTGSKNLDKLLGGGVEAMSITEVFGEFGSGKTQLAHTLCVTAQMPGPNSYVGGKVIFIDTEHTFRPNRLRPIAERFNMDQNRVLENVHYARAYNSEHQYELLNNVAAKMHQEAGIFKLLIVDSIMALFRVDYTGMAEMADRQKKLGQMLSRLQKMSEEYNIAVFITNQITSDFSSIKDEAKPVGGHIMAHSTTTRVAFKKSFGSRRFAFMFDSPELEAEETQFDITNGGVNDPRD